MVLNTTHQSEATSCVLVLVNKQTRNEYEKFAKVVAVLIRSSVLVLERRGPLEFSVTTSIHQTSTYRPSSNLEIPRARADTIPSSIFPETTIIMSSSADSALGAGSTSYQTGSSGWIKSRVKFDNTTYADLLRDIETQDRESRLSRCARIANSIAVESYAVCIRRKTQKEAPDLVKGRIMSFLADTRAPGAPESVCVLSRGRLLREQEVDFTDDLFGADCGIADFLGNNRGVAHFNRGAEDVVCLHTSDLHGLELRCRGASLTVTGASVSEVTIDHHHRDPADPEENPLDADDFQATLHFEPQLGPFRHLVMELTLDPNSSRSARSLFDEAVDVEASTCTFEEFIARWLMNACDREVRLWMVGVLKPGVVLSDDDEEEVSDGEEEDSDEEEVSDGEEENPEEEEEEEEDGSED